MRTAFGFVLATGVLAVAAFARADDWPQWRGPERNAISKETGLLKAWPKQGPTLLWTYKEAGTGFTAPAVVGGGVYTMGARADLELVIALDAKAGKELWTAKIGPVFDFQSNTWSRGPTPPRRWTAAFCTPSVARVIWCVSKHPVARRSGGKTCPKDFAGEVNNVFGGPDTAKMGWGYTWSPFVDGDKLICIPGGPDGLFAALNKKTGSVLWRSKDVKDAATYASPIAAEIGGVRQYVALVQGGLVGVSAKDGSVVWQHRRDSDYPDVVCPTPVVQGDFVYASVGMGGGCDLLKIEKDGDKFKATSVYSKKAIASRQGGVILIEGNVYGPHEDRAWMCQDFETGATKWESNRRAIGMRSLGIRRRRRLYVVSEGKGEVAMIDCIAEGVQAARQV